MRAPPVLRSSSGRCREELGPAENVVYRLSGVDVPHGSLRARDFGEGLDLAEEVRLGRAKVVG